jgi:hypothetical protein
VTDISEAKARLREQLDYCAELDKIPGIRFPRGLNPDIALLLASHDALEDAIDAARLEGIRLGLEAAVRTLWENNDWEGPICTEELIRALDPATIAREAVLDKLASEAQEQGMGYEKEADQ